MEYIYRFLTELDFYTMYPNFPSIRVGAIHPFATLLFQEVMGQQYDLTVFPSITVSDSEDHQSDYELGEDFETFSINPVEWTQFKGDIQQGLILTSEANVAKVDAKMASTEFVTAVRRHIRKTHNIDFNIWAGNKDLVSTIYDILGSFFVAYTDILHKNGYDVEEILQQTPEYRKGEALVLKLAGLADDDIEL